MFLIRVLTKGRPDSDDLFQGTKKEFPTSGMDTRLYTTLTCTGV